MLATLAAVPPSRVDMEVAKPEASVLAPAVPAPVVQTVLSTTDDMVAKENDVTQVAPEFLIKHPLQNIWTLWYFEPIKGAANWEAGQREITSIDTVEDFWSIYNHIKLASEIKQGCDYSLFKQGISPMWEDPQNVNGGRWLLSLERRHRATDLDKFWLDLCLCLIGEAFKHADQICGTVVNIRPKIDKISIWTMDLKDNTNILELGKDFKDKLKLGRLPIQYVTHRDQMRAGSTTKNICTL